MSTVKEKIQQEETERQRQSTDWDRSRCDAELQHTQWLLYSSWKQVELLANRSVFVTAEHARTTGIHDFNAHRLCCRRVVDEEITKAFDYDITVAYCAWLLSTFDLLLDKNPQHQQPIVDRRKADYLSRLQEKIERLPFFSSSSSSPSHSSSFSSSALSSP